MDISGALRMLLVSAGLTLGLLMGGMSTGACSSSSSSSSPPGGKLAGSPASVLGASHTAGAPEQSATQAANVFGSGASTLADVVEKAMPSVVNVRAERIVRGPHFRLEPFFNDPLFRHFFGPRAEPPTEQRRKSLGSGVVISTDGLVVTNSHVVDGAEKLRVSIAGGPDLPVEVIGSDPKADVALLRVETGLEHIQPLPYSDSSEIRLGDIVLAIGNPFGVGQTVTMGIISATGRANVGVVEYEDFIQTDAAINPGNSGGPLVNMKGEMIGINTAILSRSGGYQGVGFAIPSNMVQEIAASLLASGKVMRGWLGVVIQTLDADLVKAMDLPVDVGVIVSDVAADSPADKAGLERGDVLVAIDGKEVGSSGRVRNLVANAGAGAEIEIQLIRDGKRKKLRVTLGELPSEEPTEVESQAEPLAGMTIEKLTSATRRAFDIPKSIARGVVVAKVEQGSRAAEAGIRPGDVIVEINQTPVDSVRPFRKQYEASESYVLLLINRRGSTVYVALRK